MVPEERRGKQEKQVMSVPAQPITRAPRPPAAAPEGMPLRQPTPTPPPPLERTKNTATKLSSVDAASSIEIGPFPLSREHKERDPLEIREGSAGGSGFNISGEWVPPARAGEPRRGETANYYSWREVYPELEVLVRGMADIVAECDQVAAWKAWPEKHYDEGGNHDWKVIRFRGLTLLLGSDKSLCLRGQLSSKAVRFCRGFFCIPGCPFPYVFAFFAPSHRCTTYCCPLPRL